MLTMLATMLAQAGGVGIGGYSIGQLAIILIVVCGIIAVCWVVFKAMGFQPPDWLIKVLVIIAVVVVGVIAIRFLMSL